MRHRFMVDILLAGTARVKRLVMPMPISFVKRLNITEVGLHALDHHHARKPVAVTGIGKQ